MKMQSVADVVRWRLCLGCGACSFLAGRQSVQMIDVEEEGLRPVVRRFVAEEQATALQVCPGLGIDHSDHHSRPGIKRELAAAFGPVLEIWEGYAADPEIRFKGSSGGALTALSLCGLQEERLAGVLQVGQDPADPLRNSTRLSTDRTGLLACMGSRYAPASVCDRLDLVEAAPGPCVVVAQPSEVAALRRLETLRPGLAAKVGLVLSFFCAGSPPTGGTRKLLSKLEVPERDLDQMRYRGHGWPGMFTTGRKSRPELTEHMTYQQSWAFLQGFRPYATHLFPDGSGEGADISCGDPWYRPIEPGEPGSSLIVVRTPRGREFLQRALAAGYLVARPATPEQLARSQANLTAKRGAIWGRLLALRLMGVPTPRHRGLDLFVNWWRLPFREKGQSLFGTVRRALTRRFRRPLPPIPG